jgi:threonine synthase
MQTLRHEPAGMWRYAPFLPELNAGERCTLGEVPTPMLPLPRIGAALQLDLWIKEEGALPTGSFKARGAALGVSMARHLRMARLAMATAGNAGLAWALYCARAGIELTVAIPERAEPRIFDGLRLAGALTHIVDGSIADAGRWVREVAVPGGSVDVSTFREPFRLEGKMTLGFEIADQFDLRLPQVVIYPCGGGVGLLGMWRAWEQLRDLGWTSAPLPRLVAVQADGCAPVVKALESGEDTTHGWPEPSTEAHGLRVPAPLAGALILRALRQTDGTAIAVSDEAMRHAQNELAHHEGLAVGLEAAATLAGCEELRRRRWLAADASVLLVATGR